MTRRRSRALLPHEILANLRTTSQPYERVPSSNSSQDDSSQRWHLSSQSSIPTTQSQPLAVEDGASSSASQAAETEEHDLSKAADKLNPGTSTEPSTAEASRKSNTETHSAFLPESNAHSRDMGVSGGLLRSLSQVIPKRRRPDSLGKRRHSSFIIHDDEKQVNQQAARHDTTKDMQRDSSSGIPAESSHPLRRTSSLVRLSMSLEGKAQVTTSTGTTPSPPRAPPVLYPDSVTRPISSLQRSFSAVESTRRDSGTKSSLRRQTTGRSRDARTWEFYCDKDARDALTEQAEREESGSAAAVIALIKSNSDISKAVTSKSNKRNAHSHKVEATKRLKATEATGQRLKLSRSQSSLANMQTCSSTIASKTETTLESHHKLVAKSVVFERNEGDSDKENWIPGTQQRNPLRRRPAASQSQRQVLEVSVRHSPSLGALESQETNFLRKLPVSKAASSNSSVSGKENRGSDAVEIISFEGDNPPPREPDDLDCVQNLLSLSQAAWQ